MSAYQDGLLREAVALAPSAVLRSLADTAADAAERPSVRVYLAGGQVLEGVAVRVGDDHGQSVAVLNDPRTGHFGYVLLAGVVAVEVLAPERVQDVLTDGRVAPPVDGEPVSLLALRREFAATPEFPLEVGWRALPDSGAARVNLDRILRGLRDVVGEVRADEMGRQAWAQVQTVTIDHRSGAPLSVEAVPSGLAVRADLVAALPRDVTGELRRQLNVLL
ncbi:MAG TPA: hypothetical protein VGP26_06080 [Actinophytocola sp.]|jgi:hypothetical protein|nr:hypothetical protein [Actinophytocola sp.]